MVTISALRALGAQKSLEQEVRNGLIDISSFHSMAIVKVCSRADHLKRHQLSRKHLHNFLYNHIQFSFPQQHVTTIIATIVVMDSSIGHTIREEVVIDMAW